jgi:hypothetical protein
MRLISENQSSILLKKDIILCPLLICMIWGYTKHNNPLYPFIAFRTVAIILRNIHFTIPGVSG